MKNSKFVVRVNILSSVCVYACVCKLMRLVHTPQCAYGGGRRRILGVGLLFPVMYTRLDGLETSGDSPVPTSHLTMGCWGSRLGLPRPLWRIWTQTSGFCSKHFRVVSRRSLSLSLLLPLLPSLWLPLPPPSPSLPPYLSLSYNLSLLSFLRVQTVLPGGLGMADGKHLPAGVRAAAGSLEPN